MAWTTFHQLLACGTGYPLICPAWRHFWPFDSDGCWPAQIVWIILDHNWLHSARSCFPQSAASTGWIRSPRSTSRRKTWLKVLDISSLEFYPYSIVAYIHRSLSMYLTMAVVVPKPNRQLPKKFTSVKKNDHLSLSKTIFCRCQQTSSVAVNKLFNCRRSLNQSTSNKTSLQKRPEVKKFFKGNYKPTMYFVLCIVCCVSQYCVVPTMKCKFFQQNLIFFHKNIKIYFMLNY